MATPKKTVKPVAKAAAPVAKTETEAPKAEVKAPVAAAVEAPKAEEKKAAAPKAEEKKAAAPKSAKKPAAVKAETAKKAEPKKPAAKKPAVKKTVKKADQKTVLHVQFSGKSFSQEELVKIAQDVWKYDLKQKVRELASIELYVKPEENKVYYVMNQEFTGDFNI